MTLKPSNKSAQKDAEGEGSEGCAAAEPHVAYCMMTFIIRNGLKNLKEGKAAYRDNVKALVKRY